MVINYYQEDTPGRTGANTLTADRVNGRNGIPAGCGGAGIHPGFAFTRVALPNAHHAITDHD
ncbi:hypothetical protein [Burkholderia cepacia]|uniref:hypothetical protein n=1 Tax=Burkholderia cepacia TaxID=292 RepID=UPI0012D97B1E|nr:hypothetical protein [Burkholderia cepacia]